MPPNNAFPPSFEGKSPFLIAEIGTSHGGSLAKAADLIQAAKEAGADAAKFQIVYADELVHPGVGSVALPGGSTDLYRAFQQAEQSADFYAQVQSYCREARLEFTASAFGPKSLALLADLAPRFFKLASPELNYYPLIDAVNRTPMKVIASVGVSTIADIRNALRSIRQPAALLHCVTAYPTPESACNLRSLPFLARLSHLPVGWSDHTEDPVAAPLVAFYYGAAIIEKHLRLSGSTQGLDDAFALTPSQFKQMSTALHHASQLSRPALQAALQETLGERRLKTLAGSRRHRLTQSEKVIYATTNRSWIALTDIQKGDRYTPETVACLRCEGNHHPGLRPSLRCPSPWGKRAPRATRAGEGI